MPLNHLEHFLIQTAEPEGTRDWYVDVLGMRVGPAPDFKFPVYWLYLGDRDVLHITEGGAAVRMERRMSKIWKRCLEGRTKVIDPTMMRRRDQPMKSMRSVAPWTWELKT